MNSQQRITKHRALLKLRLRENVKRRHGFLVCEFCLQPSDGLDMHEIIPRGWTPGLQWQIKHLQSFYCEENCVLLCRTCHEQAHSNAVRQSLLEMKLRQGYDIAEWLEAFPLSHATLGALRRWLLYHHEEGG